MLLIARGNQLKTSALRPEFVLVGLATTFAIFLLVAAHPWQIVEDHSGLSDLAPGSALLFLGILIAVGYVVGLIVVQATFFYPTKRLITQVRDQRFRQLGGAFGRWDHANSTPRGPRVALMRQALTGPTPSRPESNLSSAVKAASLAAIKPWGWLWRRLGQRLAPPDELSDVQETRTARSLLLTLGRAEASETVVGEYEYRRSNRQMFVGLLPGIWILFAAGVRHSLAAEAKWWAHAALLLACLIAAIMATGIAISSAIYQEKVAQAVLLDTAYLSTLYPGAAQQDSQHSALKVPSRGPRGPRTRARGDAHG